MFERLIGRANQAAERRARVLAGELAERVRAEAPVGIDVEAASEGVILSGRRIGARFALEPALRWLVARIR